MEIAIQELLEEASRMGLNPGTEIKSPWFTYNLRLVSDPEYDEERKIVKANCENEEGFAHNNVPLWQDGVWVRVISITETNKQA